MASDTSTTESVLERARNPKQQLTRENLESAAKTGLLAVSALVALVPLYWMVTTSLKTSQEASQFPPTLFPDNPTIQPYIEGWNAGMWPTWFFNTTVISAIDIACWDIKGKVLDQPVYNLLGGKVHGDRLRTYANGWYTETTDDLDTWKRAAERVVADGYDAMKFDPFGDAWQRMDREIGRAHV